MRRAVANTCAAHKAGTGRVMGCPHGVVWLWVAHRGCPGLGPSRWVGGCAQPWRTRRLV
jgi:hypothetical protein